MKRPFLIKQPNNFFYVCYPNKYTGKRNYITTGTRSKSEANEFFKKFSAKLKESDLKYITMSKFIEKFAELSTDISPGGMQNYKVVAKQLIEFHKDRVLQQYSIEDFDKFLSHKKNTTSIVTAYTYRVKLKTMFNQAVVWGYLEKNLIHLTKKFKLPEADPHPMTKQEFSQLINSISSPLYKDLFTFAVLSGMRMDELVNLKPSQINIKKKSIVLQSNKTGKTRFIDLHNSLIPIYEKYKDQEYLFIGNRDKKKLNKKWLIKVTKRMIRKSGINPVFSFHSLRSTFGYWLLLEGIPLKYISKQLGHSLQSTTEKHYVKYLDNDLMGYVDRVSL